jgi:integrase
MERRLKITKRTVDGAIPEAQRFTVWDSDLPGFGLRVEPSGTKSYIVRYRAEGGGRNAPQRYMTIGKSGALTPDEARRKARETLGAVAVGNDPADKLAAARREMTVADLCDLYLNAVPSLPTRRGGLMKPSTLRCGRGLVASHIKPLIGTKRISSVEAKDIEQFMVDVATGKTSAPVDKKGRRGGRTARGGKGAASHAVGWLSATFSYARRLGLVKVNPCIGVSKFATRKIERFLSTEELERLGAAMREAETTGVPWEPDPSKQTKHAPKPENRFTLIDPGALAAIRLLLLTGARCGEILGLRWEWVDLERGILFLPDSKTGKKAIILNGPATAILESLPRSGPYVIPGADPETPRADLKKPWATLCRRAKLDGVRLHDLRHTHASFGVSAGFGLPIVGKLLGHTQPQTTARYAHLDVDPVRRASDAIGRTLADALDGRVRGRVVAPTSTIPPERDETVLRAAGASVTLPRRPLARRGAPSPRMR